MSRAAYSRRTCYVCRADVSAAGCAWASHMMKHVREGKVRRIQREFGGGCVDFQIIRKPSVGPELTQPIEPEH